MCACIYMHVSMHVCICVCDYVFMYICVCLSISLSDLTSEDLFLHLPALCIALFVYTSLNVSLTVLLSLCWFIVPTIPPSLLCRNWCLMILLGVCYDGWTGG